MKNLKSAEEIMLKEEILKTIKNYNLIEQGDRIVIGVSGGPDSICLLHILYKLKEELKIEILVAHINHMIRGSIADEETEYVQEFCNRLGIKCFIKKEDIIKLAKEQKKGSEEVRKKCKI